MSKIMSKDNCIYCVRAKALLDQKGVEYKEEKLGVDFTVEELVERSNGGKSFPQIWLTVDGEEVHIGGYDKLVEHYNNGA